MQTVQQIKDIYYRLSKVEYKNLKAKEPQELDLIDDIKNIKAKREEVTFQVSRALVSKKNNKREVYVEADVMLYFDEAVDNAEEMILGDLSTFVDGIMPKISATITALTAGWLELPYITPPVFINEQNG